MVRCAIYTRKSSDERQDKQYSSLEHQRIYCSAYITSQAGNEWSELPTHYDDGGFSGGTLNRPALTRLRQDIAAGLVDMVVVYKIDRLSRSLKDFANLVSEFENFEASFSSVTQAFDTSHSMGRLTLNVLLSFAQFERELTGERLKDWFAGARAKGMWVPNRPYGYAKANGNWLVPHPEEAPIIKRIFERYCKLASCHRVADELFEDGIMGKTGRPWTGNMILHTIKHRVYRGDLVHRGQRLPGTHKAIITEALWQKTQKAYQNSKWTKRATRYAPVLPALKGLVFDRTGMRMHHTFMHSKGKLYRYYLAGSERRRYGESSSSYMRFRAEELENSVIRVIEAAEDLMENRERHRSELIETIRRHVSKIEIDLEKMKITFHDGRSVDAIPAGRIGEIAARPRPQSLSTKREIARNAARRAALLQPRRGR
ncbi:recombinase family protein [Xanthobacteraceae bacterium A53D]